ncbi:MAG TPA: adenine deaminase [Bacteroidales bacterium]
MKIIGNLVDIHNREIFPARIIIKDGKISDIEKVNLTPDSFILPGLIDAHIHIESSMITPGAFAKAAVKHGTTGVVSDPHEIANVIGEEGVLFMIRDAEKVPMKFWFGVPSCVPATSFETSGATLDKNAVKRLFERTQIKYLSEMMNFPGVISEDPEVIAKIDIARKLNKPIDGHAPGLTGESLKKYVAAGISTDHECSSIEEALEKISLGMNILIREGSAARNLESLKELFNLHPRKVMLCSDDLHPEMLQVRHINKIIGKLISEGFDTFDVIRSATINPVNHYGLDAGLLRIGDNADFILVDDLNNMNVSETWIDGKRVFGNGKVEFSYLPDNPINNFNCNSILERDIKVVNKQRNIRVIEAFEGELLTKQLQYFSGISDNVESDIGKDILKIIVKDRYNNNAPAIGFIKGFGLKNGAFASSVAHDSHNIISVGTNDIDIMDAVNEIVRMKGGLAVSSGGKTESIQLNIAGIMTTRSCDEVAHDYEKLNEMVKSFGCTMAAPFMTLSFMALLVIPDLKIGDRGLFDVKKFELVPLFVD